MHELYDGGAKAGAKQSPRVVHTRVLDNCDRAGLGRVMVQIPWLDGPVPASVVTGTAGKGCGMYFIPQKDDEVLVLVKEHPELAAYVIGSVWTSQDTPPRREPDAASHVQLIRTPGGHEISFDDRTGEVVISTTNGQSVSLTQNGVEIRAAKGETAASITLTTSGNIVLSANSIELNAKQKVTVGGARIAIDANGDCAINGAMVRINEPGGGA